MKNLKIITGENNPVLRTTSVSVKKFDVHLKKLVKAMKDALIDAKGLGLAAPQVGENVRLFITTLNYSEDLAGNFSTGGVSDAPRLITMVNPEILSMSDETSVAEEGCLSLPGIYGNVERSVAVKVAFFDVDGNKHVLELEGLDARVIQHEYDHLDGVLFVDKLVS